MTQETLCWTCKNTNRDKCPWFDPDDPQPVEGWNAIRVDGRPFIGTSYTVLECPKYDRMPPRIVDTVGYPGIYRDELTNEYVAYMVVRKQPVFLGRFTQFEQAFSARRRAEREERKRGKQRD